MSNVFNVVSKIFDLLFIRSNSIFGRLILYLNYYPLLTLGTFLLIVGFSVGVIKRIIRS